MKMAYPKINIHPIRLIIFGLLLNVSTSKEHIRSQVRTIPPPNISSDNVSSDTLTTVYQNTTTDRRQNIVFTIGKRLCPYNDHCRRQKEVLPFPDIPCCIDCSCEDNCWETQTCCPDKDMLETRDPVENCHVTIVKKRNKTTFYNGLYYGIKAYRIIDNCPESEQNLSVINKCALLDIDHISDYNWVSNFSAGKIYQNKFCAACYGETGLTEWRMEARCEDVLYSNFSHLKSLLLSDKCDIINREPSGKPDHPYTTCFIPLYSRCNQTGLWETYDQDIDWACNIHEALFLEADSDYIYLYKNAFCYECNQQKNYSATTVCKTDISTIRNNDSPVFGTLINYKRDDYLENYQPASDFACEVNEMFDPYLQICRTLICPFASVPFYGKCEKLMEHTLSLAVEVIYTLTVLWSDIDMDIFLKDDAIILEIVGNKLLRKLQDVFYSKVQCRYCYQCLRLLKSIKKSTYSRSESNITTGNTNFSDPKLLFYSIWLTDEVCPLQELIHHALQVAGSSIQIEDNSNILFSLQLGISKENSNTMIKKGRLIKESRRYQNCYVTYKITKEVICSQIRIRYSEFEPLIEEKNADIIKSMFTTNQMRFKEYKEICVEEYFKKLGDINDTVIQNRGYFQPRAKIIIFLNTMIITEFIQVLAR